MNAASLYGACGALVLGAAALLHAAGLTPDTLLNALYGGVVGGIGYVRMNLCC